MKRQEALRKAHNYLKSRSGQKVKEKARKNSNLSYMSVAHAVADIYQKGENPKDMDLQKIDWGVSYGNIRKQIDQLLKKRTGNKFESRREDQIDAEMAKTRKQKQERNTEVARRRHSRRPDYNQMVDETKNAQRTFSHATDKAFKKWKNNMNKYDMKGVDTRKDKEARTQAQLPFRRKSEIQDMKQDIRRTYGSLKGFSRPETNPRFEKASKKEALKEKKIAEFEKDTLGKRIGVESGNELVSKGREAIRSGKNLDLEGSKLAENKDRRDLGDVTRNIRGKMDDRTDQKNFREMGMATKGNEKTLDKFQKSVSKSGDQITSKFDGEYY